MPYVRISLVTPRPGFARRVEQLLEKIVALCQGQPGYLAAYLLDADDSSGAIGRVTAWTDQHSADVLAQTEHMLALRSLLNQVIVEGSHEEHGFQARDASALGRDALSPEEIVRMAEAIVRGNA